MTTLGESLGVGGGGGTTAVITINENGIQVIKMEESTIIRQEVEGVGTSSLNVEVTVHVGREIVEETIRQYFDSF